MTKAFIRTNRITSMSSLPLFSLTQRWREDTSVNTGNPLKANPSGIAPEVSAIEGPANGFSRVSRLAPTAQIVVWHSFLYLTVCRNVQLTVRVTKVEWLSAPAVPLTVIV
jgi:hypothetical protein